VEPVKSRADESAGSILVLPSLLDLTAAETLCRSFLERLSAFDSIVIEGAEVDRVSTAAIQVLLAAAEDARSRGISFQLNEPSEALADALSDLGLPVFLAL
jgi:chemotaxis protein CheX